MRSAAVNCVFHCNMTCCDGRYSDGHIYIGHWRKSQRSGFGRLEETSRRNSLYTGSWEMDKRNGYGVYEDKMRYIHIIPLWSTSMRLPCLWMHRHERYLGMWNEGVKSGPGMFVTSTGSYGEAIFSAGHIAVSGEMHVDLEMLWLVWKGWGVHTCT